MLTLCKGNGTIRGMKTLRERADAALAETAHSMGLTPDQMTSRPGIEREMRALVEEIAAYVGDAIDGQPPIGGWKTVGIGIRRRFLGPASAEEVATSALMVAHKAPKPGDLVFGTSQQKAYAIVKALRNANLLREGARSPSAESRSRRRG